MVHPQGKIPSTKRQGQSLSNVNSVIGPKTENYLLHVTDTSRGEQWLVDGGALISIIPPTPRQRRKGPSGVELRAANGSSIPCYGSVNRSIRIGRQWFRFDFTVADVTQRILGADFLAEYYLAPNHRDAVLINLQDFSILPAKHALRAVSTPINFVSQANDPCYKVLDRYPEILKPTFTISDPKHGVKHHIPTSGAPCQSRSRRLDQEKLAVAKAELGKLVDLGIAYKGRSEWASPLLVTTKPCGGWRVCGDYRRLNAMTTDDRYPVRTLQDFTSELHGKVYFSKIDLLKGYHQIPVAEEDVPKTAVITPFGLYIFPRTPFGLKNAGQDFQRLMDSILGDLPRVFVYIDDILVASETLEQHLEDLDAVFKVLSANGLVIRRDKCLLGQSSLEFLGYHVDQNGIAPLPDRVKAIEAVTPPTTVKELQRFLGMVGYYRRFIPNAAKHLFHLFDALKGPKTNKPKTLNWTPGCQTSFEATKTALAAATLLHHPRPGATLALTTDASNSAIGGVLEQRGPRGWEPLAFYSSKLEPNQQLWPPYDRELLAAFKGTRHFRSWIEGRPFTLYTDHQSLVPSIHKKTDPQTLRQTYQLACISEYTTDIRYLEGKANVVADSLSRPNEEVLGIASVESSRVESSPPTSVSAPSSSPSSSPLASPPSSEDSAAARRVAKIVKEEEALEDLDCIVNAVGDLGIDWVAIASQQPLDPEYRQLKNSIRSGLELKAIDIGQKKLIVDMSNGIARPFIPYASRRKIFESFHNLGHPGVERTRAAICAKVVWPSIREDTSKWARECLHCQQAKVTRHTVPPIGEFEVPNRRFEHINVDLVTLPVSNGFKYLLTAVDRFTRWPVAVPLVNITVQSVVDALAHGWIQQFGVPTTITTDRGAQFSSAIFQQLTKLWGIKQNFTAPYHPESNGLVERFHRRLKESLIALGHEHPEQWFWKLPMSMLSIRTTLKPDVGASPADLVYGEGLAVPGEMLPSTPATDPQLLRQRAAALSDMRLEVARLQPTQTSAHRRPLVHLPSDLGTCTHVFVRRGGIQSTLSSPYIGPFRVVSRTESNFRVAIAGRSNETVSIGRVKPAYCSIDDAEEAAPPSPPPAGRRPRPPPQPQNPPRRNPRRRRPRSEDEANHRDVPSQPLQGTPPPPPPPPPPEREDWFDLNSSPPRHPSSPIRPVRLADPIADPPADPIADPPAVRRVPAEARPDPPEPRQQLFADLPPPPPPPSPPRPRRRRKQGNPNWVKGGSFAGARWKEPDQRPRPDVSVILSHLGISTPSSTPPQHECDAFCSL